MTSRPPALWLVLLLLGLVHTAPPFVAQTKRNPSPKQQLSVPEPPHDSKQQAMEILPLLSERIDALKSPAWKVRLKGFLAGVLAQSNPEGARQLFQQSLQSLEAAPVQRSPNTPVAPDEIAAWELSSLRSELMTLAAKADPAYAESLAESLAATAPGDSSDAELIADEKLASLAQRAWLWPRNNLNWRHSGWKRTSRQGLLDSPI